MVRLVVERQLRKPPCSLELYFSAVRGKKQVETPKQREGVGNEVEAK